MRFIEPPFIGAPTPLSPWFCEEVWLKEPNLWLPRKQPLGNIKLDSSHPYYSYIDKFYYFHRVAIDLKNNESLTIVNSEAGGVPYAKVDKGESGYYCLSNYKHLTGSPLIVKGGSVPLLVLGRFNNYDHLNTETNCLYNFYNDYNRQIIGSRPAFGLIFRARGQLQSSTSDLNSTTSVRGNGWFTFAAYHEWNTPKAELYINGVLEASHTTSSGTTGGTHTPYILDNTNSGTGWSGLCTFLAIFQGRKFNASEIVDLCKNEYQFFDTV